MTHDEDARGDLLLTQAQAARFLHIRPGSLANWRWRGEGPPFVRLSRRAIRYRRSDLDAWIRTRVRKSTSDTGHGDVG